MSEFVQVEQAIRLQLAPDAIDPRSGPVQGPSEVVDANIELDR